MFKSPLLFIAVIIVLVSCHTSVKGQAPDAVQKTFEAKYPGETDPDWHLDSNGNYEARFRIKGIRHRADFSKDGQWIETEVSISKKDLPEAVKAAIDKDYGDEKITEIEKVEHHSKGLFYDVEFKRKGKNKDVEFTASGSVL